MVKVYGCAVRNLGAIPDQVSELNQVLSAIDYNKINILKRTALQDWNQLIT